MDQEQVHMTSWLKYYTNQWSRNSEVYAKFKDNAWVEDLTEIGSLCSKNRGIKYLLCVVDVSSKYTWVKSLKNKKAKLVPYGSIEIVNEFNHKPNNWLIKENNFTKALWKNG